MSDLTRLWDDLDKQAAELDPDALRAVIMESRDDGLRAASYDGASSSRSANRSSHPERIAMSTKRDTTDADLQRLDELVDRYVVAVYEIATRAHSGPFPNDWRSARLGHKRLCDMDAIGVLERLPGLTPSKHIHRAGDCLHDLEVLARRHTARNPSRDERDWTDGLGDKDVCAWHLSVHRRYRRPRVPGKNICHDCAAVSELLGQKPPTWLIEAMIDHGDRPIAWRASLSRAMDELGIVREAG